MLMLRRPILCVSAVCLGLPVFAQGVNFDGVRSGADDVRFAEIIRVVTHPHLSGTPRGLRGPAVSISRDAAGAPPASSSLNVSGDGFVSGQDFVGVGDFMSGTVFLYGNVDVFSAGGQGTAYVRGQVFVSGTGRGGNGFLTGFGEVSGTAEMRAPDGKFIGNAYVRGSIFVNTMASNGFVSIFNRVSVSGELRPSIGK